MRLPLLVAALSIACVAPRSDEPTVDENFCPVGWTYDPYSNGACKPSASVVSSAEKTVGDGVIGFARLVTGTCNMCGDNCTCAVDLLKGREVRAYAGEVRADDKTCAMPGMPVATTTIDANGMFAIKLPKGVHTIAIFDPEAKCDAGRTADVAGVRVVPIVMDYGAY